MKIYERHTQLNAIDFMDYVIAKFPFRIHTVGTDNGHEFQARSHWHLADLGIRHVYIKPRTPRLNGKVERSHGTDEDEFYQLLTYTDDVDLNAKLAQCERYYNHHRPNGGLGRSITVRSAARKDEMSANSVNRTIGHHNSQSIPDGHAVGSEPLTNIKSTR